MTTKQVWRNYSVDLKRFIFSKVKDRSVTDDILQDTFIKIHTKLHTLKDITKLKPWIFSITRNSIIDYFKTSRQKATPHNVEETSEEENHAHTEQDCLRAILKNLPKKYRTPLFLSDIKGFKQQEIAKQLNQSLVATKSQIQRARKLIAQGFMDCCGFVMNKNGKLVGEIQDKDDCKICK